MACLGGKAYDPAVSVSKSTAALLAMTALDTTNLRIASAYPASGRVLVRIKGVLHGATTFPQVLFCVLQAGVVVGGRDSPIGAPRGTALATTAAPIESAYIIEGTPGQPFTWDAAYGVEVAVASTGLKYGGPNDTTANNAFGAIRFEVWAA